MGDAVITSGFINSLKQSVSNTEIDVLGHPNLEVLLRSFCTFRDYIPINLPGFGHHEHNFSEIKLAFNRILMMRKRKYDYCLNIVGDTRENLIGKISGAKQNIAPIWDKNNLFRSHIRNRGASLLIDHGIYIPQDINNIYDSVNYFCSQLGLHELTWLQNSIESEIRDPEVIAIHPGASKPSKLWAIEKWKALINKLHKNGKHIVLLGSPSERNKLFEMFQTEIDQFSIEVVTEGLPFVLQSISKASLLIGMDSFSVHAAYALGVPSVVLHGPFLPEVMTPPGSIALSAGFLCDAFPCYNKPSCQKTAGEFICIRGIDIEPVLTAVRTQLRNCRRNEH